MKKDRLQDLEDNIRYVHMEERAIFTDETF
jgi:hypothetical protein